MLFKRIKDKIILRLDSVAISDHLSKIMEPLYEIEKYHPDDDDSDMNSESNTDDSEDVLPILIPI